MSDTAIRVENLGKRYHIGERQRYKALRDTLTDALYAPFRAAASLLNGHWAPTSGPPSNNYIWALKDVSLEVKKGEIVGIIGRNGAGKSTLLKILSRITKPTEGYARIHGRVGSLLEVGTGFHPELTGRENVYLNGALLGMKKAEIDRKFDEIVAFAEVEKFIDTPVKHYSSGMRMRLAFAVAAHLEPEILLVDEVLAVGDAVFQKKCLGKMGDVAREGRTVLFVSHNMGAIRQLCPRSVLFGEGRTVMDGDVAEVISFYLSENERLDGSVPGEITWSDPKEAPGNDELRLVSVRLIGPDSHPQNTFELDKPIYVDIVYSLRKSIRGMRVNLSLFTGEGILAFISTDHNQHPPEMAPGIYHSICKIPAGLLNKGRYLVEIDIDIPGVRVLVPGQTLLSFTTDGAPHHGSNFPETWPGVVCPQLQWHVKQAPGVEKAILANGDEGLNG